MEKEHYYSANKYYQSFFGKKLYRLAIDGGFTCPNRDGRKGYGGCSFCSEQGSGDFTPKALSCSKSIDSQIDAAKNLVASKKPGLYMAYLQAFTNTYAPLDYLRDIYSQCLRREDICALSLGTRPDCISEEVVKLISELSLEYNKPVYVELGLQTIHVKTEKYLGRGYNLEDFNKAYALLNSYNINTIVHVIIGLPGESRDDMLETINYLSKLKPHGVKISLLNIIKATKMEGMYLESPEAFALMDMNSYLKVLGDCVSHLDKDIVLYRMTGDAPKRILTAPLFVGDKKLVLNSITKYFKENNIYQGDKAPC